MSAEDELRQLDEALAAGQLSAEDYQRRRDALLSQSGDQQSQRTDPFPPAFRWETTRPEETTQYITPVSETGPGERADPEDGSEQTQIVAHGGPEPTGDSDTTQIVPAQPAVPPPPGGTASPPANQTWSGYRSPLTAAGSPSQGPPPGDGTTPPWVGTDAAEPGWSASSYPGRDGFESFERKPSPGRGRIFALIGAVVVIAALATGVVLFLSLRSGPTTDDPAAGPAPPPATAEPTTSAAPKPFGPLVVPSGEGPRLETFSPRELDEVKPLPTPDLIMLKQAGIEGARSVIIDADGTTTSLWAFTATREPAALQEAMDLDQRRFDFVRAPEDGAGGLPVYTSEQQSSEGRDIVVFRTHYVSGSDVIRVECYAQDAGAARERFDAVLADQLEHTPPS